MATSLMLTSASMRLAQAVSRYLAEGDTAESQKLLSTARERFNTACAGSPGGGFTRKPFQASVKPGVV